MWTIIWPSGRGASPTEADEGDLSAFTPRPAAQWLGAGALATAGVAASGTRREGPISPNQTDQTEGSK